MNLNEAKKILSENNYEVIDKQQVNEWGYTNAFFLYH